MKGLAQFQDDLRVLQGVIDSAEADDTPIGDARAAMDRMLKFGAMLENLDLRVVEAEPQGAPPTTLEQAWDEGFEEGEGARRENPYRAKGAPERVTIEHPPGFGLSLDAELLAAKGAPQKPESG